MIKSLTNQKLYGLVAGLMSLLLMAFVATPAQAQMGDGELPKVDVGGAVASDAQAILVSEFDNDDFDTSLGFNRVAAQIQTNVQFSENVSGYMELSAEPEENTNFSKVTTNIDFVYVNVNVAENLMVQAGTPGIGISNFPRWSDGALVQGNPLVGNSVAQTGTAGNGGAKLIGSYPSFGFDVTVTRNFGGGQDVNAAGQKGTGTGVDIYGRARYTGADIFNLGAGVAFATGNKGLAIANGDGDYYNVPAGIQTGGVNAPSGFSNHPTLPSDVMFQVDGEVTPGALSANAALGYASQSATGSAPDPAAIFGVLGAKYDVNDSFFIAGRYSVTSDQTDYASDLDKSSIWRAQLGVGYTYEATMLKLEYANQSQVSENDTSSPFANQSRNWQAITAQFSVAF
jgi:hypothetical protein